MGYHGRMVKQSKMKGHLNRWKLVGVVIVALSLAWLVQVKISQHYDGQRFAEADKKRQTVFMQLVQRLGAPTKIDDSNVCYNSEQGPFDNGRLWCQIASAAYFRSTLPKTTINEYFREIVEANGYMSTDQRVGELEFEGEKDLPCELIIYEGPLALEPGFYLQADVHSKQTVIVRCSDRAKAKHYTYISG